MNLKILTRYALSVLLCYTDLIVQQHIYINLPANNVNIEIYVHLPVKFLTQGLFFGGVVNQR